MGSRLRHRQRSALSPSVTTGAVADPGTCIDYTERVTNTDIVTGNPINKSALPARFASPAQLVVAVAGKYLSGFQSPRAADDMARRLNAGLPVHRDRWLVLGAILLLALA